MRRRRRYGERGRGGGDEEDDDDEVEEQEDEEEEQVMEGTGGEHACHQRGGLNRLSARAAKVKPTDVPPVLCCRSGEQRKGINRTYSWQRAGLGRENQLLVSRHRMTARAR